MDLTKDAMEYLVGLERDEMIQSNTGKEYVLDGYIPVTRDKADCINTHTLDSVVDYVNKNVDGYPVNIIHIVDPTTVLVYTDMYDDLSRDTLMKADAFINKISEQWRDTEEFNLMLQSNFVDNQDKKKILAYVGNLKDENVKNYSDDGVSQSVTVKSGIATVDEAILPNPVLLAPYRTFSEIEQPESSFIFRMQDGPRALLIESDGNLWKIEAIKRIREYLENKIRPEIIDKRVVIYG